METVKLPKPKLKSSISVEEAISKRRSVRSYLGQDLTVEEIGQLLWAAQGVTDKRDLRAAPSAGAIYPLVVYLAKEDGLYLYHPESHSIERKTDMNLKKDLAQAALNQGFVEEAPVNIVICALYEKISSRYGKRGIKYADIEVGHVAENLHLEAVSLGLSSCPVGAFDASGVSKLLNLPDDETPVYIVPVGYEKR